ncbi:MAG: endonuclease III [Candidatus Auribacterota bacterium]|jgi:endonuclease-3|nr:endonuclease III [Candidatus Auribacterota bacterium]
MTSLLTSSQCESIKNILQKTYPDAHTALLYDTPFQFAVAAILSAQCTDVRVNEVTKRLFENKLSVEDFANMSDGELISYIKPCGLYRNKSRNIRACAKALIERFDGVIPQTHEELMSLPGVGRKTANVILATIYGKPAVAVDTHVFRVARRIGLSDGKTPDDVERDIMSNFPQQAWIALHHQLIRHGRLVCKARNPMCISCSLSQRCLFFPKNS